VSRAPAAKPGMSLAGRIAALCGALVGALIWAAIVLGVLAIIHA
jgi:hypothetical protein